MTESLTSRKPAKRSWPILFGVLLVLVIAIALLWSSYKKDPALFIRFYLKVTQRIDIGDAGVLSGEPCSAPCVFGIRAGETPFDQVPLLLEKYGVSKCETEPNISWIAIHCGGGRFNVQANTHTNLVNGIWFYPNDRISLGEILGKYGEPDYLLLTQNGVPDAPNIQMYIYWDSIRMGVVMPAIDSKTYVVEKATRVELIGFSDEDLHQDYSEIEISSGYKLWNGYGTYQP
jgi:hypothetical protein